MKKYSMLLLPLLILLLACQDVPSSLNQQSTIDLSKKTPNEFASAMKRIDQPEPDRKMNAIQSWYQQIEEHLQYLNVKTIKSADDETITFYYKNDILVKAVVESKTGRVARKDTYYWHKSKLFYCFQQVEAFTEDEKAIGETRGYIYDGKVINLHEKEKVFKGEIDMQSVENIDLTETADLESVLAEYIEKEKNLLTIFKEN